MRHTHSTNLKHRLQNIRSCKRRRKIRRQQNKLTRMLALTLSYYSAQSLYCIFELPSEIRHRFVSVENVLIYSKAWQTMKRNCFPVHSISVWYVFLPHHCNCRVLDSCANLYASVHGDHVTMLSAMIGTVQMVFSYVFIVAILFPYCVRMLNNLMCIYCTGHDSDLQLFVNRKHMQAD